MAQVSLSQRCQLTPYHFSMLRTMKHAIDVTLDQNGERYGSFTSGLTNFAVQGQCKRGANEIPDNFIFSYIDQFCPDQGHQYLKAGILIIILLFICIFIIIFKFDKVFKQVFK